MQESDGPSQRLPKSDGSAEKGPLSSAQEGPLEVQHETEMAAKLEAQDAIDYPDGGLRAWLVVAASWAVTFATFGYISSFGVFQEYYQTHQLADHSPSDIAWIGSLQLFMIFFSGMFTGYLFDAGHYYPIIVTGSVLLVLAVFLTAECTQLWQFILAQGICGGLGCGCLFLPSSAVTSHWFKRRRALAYGIMATGSSVGGVLFPILLNRLFVQTSFQWAVRAAGFLVLACIVAILLLLKPRLPARKNGRLVEFHHLKDPAFTLMVLGAFFIILGLYTPIFYISSYAESKGVDTDLSFYLLAILNAASLFGRLIPNLFADKIGPANILWSASLISGILCFCWIKVSSFAGLVVFACVYGPPSGSYLATIPAVIASITPRERMNEIGARTSLGFGLLSFAALAGTPIAGALHQNGGWVGPACFAGCVVLLGSFLGLWSRHITSKRTQTWRV